MVHGQTPKLSQWDCINGNYYHCGIQLKMDTLKYHILIECETEIDVLEWLYARRQGTYKRKQNTGLEIGHTHQHVKDML